MTSRDFKEKFTPPSPFVTASVKLYLRSVTLCSKLVISQRVTG